MLRTLIRQELLSHLMSARFFAAVVITLLLVVANAVVLLEDYEQRLARHSHQENLHRQKAQGDTIMFYYPPMLPKPDSPPKRLDW